MLCSQGQGTTMPIWWGRQKGSCWHLKAARSCPQVACKDGFSGLKWQSRNLWKSPWLSHTAVCRAVGDLDFLNLREQQYITHQCLQAGLHARKDLAPSIPSPWPHSVGAVTQTQLQQPEKVACTSQQCHIPSYWGRTERDGMKSHCCPLAPAVAPTPASSAACSSRAWLPPKTPSASPQPPAAIPLGTEPALGPGAASSLGATASGAATAIPIQGAVGRACAVSPAALTEGPAQGHHLPCPALLLGHQYGNKQHPRAQGHELQGNGTKPHPRLHLLPHSPSMPG